MAYSAAKREEGVSAGGRRVESAGGGEGGSGAYRTERMAGSVERHGVWWWRKEKKEREREGEGTEESSVGNCS